MAEEKKPGAKAAPAKTETAETVALGAEPAKARLCEPSERAGGGLKRYKVRLDGHPSGARSQRYLLAPDRDSAHACYLTHEGIEAAEVDGKAVRLVVTELPD